MIDFILGFAIAISGALALSSIRAYRKDLKQLGRATNPFTRNYEEDLEVCRRFGEAYGHTDDPRLIALIKTIERERDDMAVDEGLVKLGLKADDYWDGINQTWIKDAINDAFDAVDGKEKA